MKRPLLLAAGALAAIPLAGCASDYDGGYGYSRPHYNSSYYYPRSYGWYDGYYGSIHDGYWGNGGYYYYRLHDRDRWRRDDGRHFRHGAKAPSSRHYRYDRAAPSGRGRGHDGHDGRGRGRGHDRDDD